MDNGKKRILITGSSGFVGSFLVDEGIRRGYEVYAGVRKTSKTGNLKHENLKFFEFDLTDPVALRGNLEGFREDSGGFHYVIHSAGITKPKRIEEFEKGNADFTRDFADMLQESQTELQKFAFISSMAAQGPGDPNALKPISESDPESPMTPYGKSKQLAEKYLAQQDDLPYIVFRPTAVYGPRDQKFLLRLVNVMRTGFDVTLGDADLRSSFVYVKDLASLIYSGIEKDIIRETFNVSDGQYYTQSHLVELIKREANLKTMSIRIPQNVMLGISYTMMAINRIVQKPLHLSPYKVRELTAKNWHIDITKAKELLDYNPQYDLEKGVVETVKWLKSEKLL